MNLSSKMKIISLPTSYIKIKIYTIFLIACFFLSNSNSYSDINFAKNLPKEIYITQTPNDHARFKKNLFRAFIDGDTKKKNNIRKKYKKWFEANFSINNIDQIKTKIRLMGDWKDHLKPPKSSLKVKIIDDNSISGFRRFRLYLPKTRKKNNEIFFTTILRHLNFPSYYTFNIKVNFNGRTYDAIMQEDASKEFLERSGIPELPIIKTDEYKFYIDEKSDQSYSSKKIKDTYILYNQNFLKKNYSKEIVSDAINLAHTTNFKKMIYNNNFFETIMKKYAPHGLVEHNRKYIYVPFSNIFIPLYYDGDVNFPIYRDNNCKISSDLSEKLQKLKDEYHVLAKKKLTKKMECVAIDIFKTYDELKIQDKLILNLNNVQKIKYSDEYKDLIKLIHSYLETNINNIIYQKNSKKNFGYSYTFLYNDNYFRCYFDLKNSKIEKCFKLKIKTYEKSISTSQNIDKKDKVVKVANINLGNLNYKNKVEILNSTKNSHEYVLKENKVYYLFVNKTDQNFIKINYQNINSKIIITGNLSNKSFFFKNDLSINKNKFKPGNDRNYLNGCATILSSYLEKTNIYAENFNCEDAVNIINSHGQIDNLKIVNSLFDGADFDFSRLTIKNVEISNSKNDCLDLSFGNYTIITGKFKNCNDKGISLGETSKGNFENINISDSGSAIVVKDSSSAHVDNLNTNKIKKHCLSAYKKKQEFNGATISYKNLNCINNFYFDDFSKIYQIK